MAREVKDDSMENRRERVLQALHILVGDGVPPITEEKRAILREYDTVAAFGYGRVELVVVAHHLEGINPTLHKKRKDFLPSPQTT